jgi:tetratricopeptide (TPR) repeat protein
VGLRLAWEIPEGRLIRFISVTAVRETKSRRRYSAERRNSLLIGTGFAETGGPGRESGGADERLIRPKIFHNRAMKDFYRGITALLCGNKEEAAFFFREAAHRDDTLADAYFALSLISDNPEEQLTAVDRALIHRKGFTRLWKETGVSVCAMLTACDGKQIRLMSDFPGLELLAAEIYQSHGKTDDSCRLLENSQHAELDIFRFSCGEAHFRQQQYDQAIDLLKKSGSNRLLSGPSCYLLGLSLEKMGYHSTAIQVYRNTLYREYMSKDLEVALRLQLYRLLEAGGHRYRAEKEFDRLTALAPEYRKN